MGARVATNLSISYHIQSEQIHKKPKKNTNKTETNITKQFKWSGVEKFEVKFN